MARKIKRKLKLSASERSRRAKQARLNFKTKQKTRGRVTMARRRKSTARRAPAARNLLGSVTPLIKKLAFGVAAATAAGALIDKFGGANKTNINTFGKPLAAFAAGGIEGAIAQIALQGVNFGGAAATNSGSGLNPN